MKILVIASDKGDHFTPFIEEQIMSLQALGVQIVRYAIKRKGIIGYLQELPRLKKLINQEKPDLIHAHYGLSGLLANLQRKVPVVTTYHGSDINKPRILLFSKLSIRLSAHNIFVSQKNIDLASPKSRYSLIPCGVNLTEDQLQTQEMARDILHIDKKQSIVLFAGAFNNYIKDPDLAKQAVSLLNDVHLQELKGFTRKEVTLWMCAANCLLMTSKTEGSPQVIKEAMACGCPIVSVNVGDVEERISGVEGSYLVHTRQASEIAAAITKAIGYTGKTNGRKKIADSGLSNMQIAERLMVVYTKIIDSLPNKW